MIFTAARLRTVGLLAAAGVAGLSAAAWSGTARPWDGGLELWRWSVYLTVGTAFALAFFLGRRPQALIVGATTGAVLALVALATWLRQSWLIVAPSQAHGWWTFGNDPDIKPVTVAISNIRARSRYPSGHLTAAGYVSGALLLIAVVAALATVVQAVRQPDQSPAG